MVLHRVLETMHINNNEAFNSTHDPKRSQDLKSSRDCVCGHVTSNEMIRLTKWIHAMAVFRRFVFERRGVVLKLSYRGRDDTCRERT